MMSIIRKKNFKSLIIIMIITLFSQSKIQAADAANGEKVFKANCTSCHIIGGKLIGPNLVGVKDRWKGREAKLAAFVKNSQTVIKSGDAYANKLFKEYNGTVMTPMALSEGEIADVLEYAHTGGGGAKAPTTPTGGSSFKELPTDYPIGNILIIGVIILSGAILILGRRLMNKGKTQEVGKYNPTLNLINAFSFPLFLVIFFGGILYEVAFHTQYIMPEAASEIGVQIDAMFQTTMWITLVVFIGCQILIFGFTWIYRRQEGRKALYYSHNDKLEMVWTVIPAIVLSVLVISGFKTWQKATGDLENLGGKEVVECYAYQFAWEFRYPGPDGKLGKVDFRMIADDNPLGIDFSDPASHDDFITKELHLPVGKEALLKIRSRDVLHAAYFPHFRAQIYASPGLDNRIQFKPIFTTGQMRDKIGNMNFGNIS
jgi:cytochrome c oxidase subunit 2